MILWEDQSSTGLRAAAEDPRAVVVLPVAAVEQHGPHLPLGTDAIICDAVLDAAARHLPERPAVLRLPTQRVGVSPEHESFPGTLSVEPEGALAAWTGLGAQVARAGFRRLLVFNTHGGQPGVVDQMAVRLRRAHEMLVVRANIFGLGLPDEGIPSRERRFGLHGGLVETALMLAVRPDLVAMDRARDFHSRDEDLVARSGLLSAEGPGIGIGWLAEDLNIEGVTGNAAAATPELGRAILAHLADRLAVLLRDTAGCPLPGEDAAT